MSWHWPLGKQATPLELLELEDLYSLTGHLWVQGGTGAGKSSLIKLICEDFLRRGRARKPSTSCIWFSVKSSEPDDAADVIRAAGLEHTIMRLTPGTFTFNVASWVLTRPENGEPAALAELLQQCSRMLDPTNQSQGSEDYWRGLFQGGLEHSGTIAMLATGRDRVTLEHLAEVVNFCPSSLAEVQHESFKQGRFYKLLERAERGIKTKADLQAFKLAFSFWTQRVPSIGDKGRGALTTFCSSIFTPLLREPFYSILCPTDGKSSYTPDMPLGPHNVIVDFPVLKHQQPALLLQNMLSMLTITEALREPRDGHVTMLVKDEFQALCASPKFFSDAAAVARSHGLSFLFASQNRPLIIASMSQNEHLADALIGNMNLRLNLANSCSATNQYVSQSLGECRERFVSISESKPPQEEKFDLMDWVFGLDRFVCSISEQYRPRVSPELFVSGLRRGGLAHARWIDAVFSKAGHGFGPDQSPCKVVSFRQPKRR